MKLDRSVTYWSNYPHAGQKARTEGRPRRRERLQDLQHRPRGRRDPGLVLGPALRGRQVAQSRRLGGVAGESCQRLQRLAVRRRQHVCVQRQGALQRDGTCSRHTYRNGIYKDCPCLAQSSSQGAAKSRIANVRMSGSDMVWTTLQATTMGNAASMAKCRKLPGRQHQGPLQSKPPYQADTGAGLHQGTAYSLPCTTHLGRAATTAACRQLAGPA